MEEFTIYYGTLPCGRIKIGVDCNHPYRVNYQKLTDHRVMEVHTDVYEVSNREQELQRLHGVEVDIAPYYINYFKNKSILHRRKVSAKLMGHIHSDETKDKIREKLLGNTNTKGKVLFSDEYKSKLSIKKRMFTDEEEAEIFNKYIPRKYGHGKIAEEYGIHWRTSQDIIKRHKKRVSN
tara:strand:- start:32 stop:568 length:537 start_codon:yes stop_codon:yes gene_type:complete